MGGVAGEQQPAVAHRLADEAAEAEHRARGDGTIHQLQTVRVDPGLQLGPDPVVGPGGDVGVGIALDVHPLQGRRALADQGEASLGVAVDQLRRTRGSLAEDAVPGERVLPETLLSSAFGDLAAAGAARAVGADQQFAADLVGDTVGIGEPQHRSVGREVVDGRVGDPEPHVAAVPGARRREVDEHIGLRVEPHRRTDQIREVDPGQPPVEPDLDAGVLVTLPQHPIGHPGVDEQPDAAGFQDARADCLLDLGVRPVVHHDALDPFPGQQVREHQAGRSTADDADRGGAAECARSRRRRHGPYLSPHRGVLAMTSFRPVERAFVVPRTCAVSGPRGPMSACARRRPPPPGGPRPTADDAGRATGRRCPGRRSPPAGDRAPERRPSTPPDSSPPA